MNEIKFGVEGRFRLDALRSDGSIRELAPWQDNLVTNYGIDSLCTSRSFIKYLQVGTGTTAEAYTDTNLANRIAGVSTTDSTVWNTGANKVVTTLTASFGAGVTTGNITELGLSPSVNGNVNTRALIRDSSGNPISVTVLSNEQLLVTYTITITIPSETVVNVTEPNRGTNYTITIRPGQPYSSQITPSCLSTHPSSLGNVVFASYPDAIYSTGAQPAPWASASLPSNFTNPLPTGVHTDGTMYHDTTLSVPVGKLYHSISTVMIGDRDGAPQSYGGFCCPFTFGFSPAFTKTAIQSITFTVRCTWVR